MSSKIAAMQRPWEHNKTALRQEREFPETLDRLKSALLRHRLEPGLFPTAIDGLRLSRRDTVNRREDCFYCPLVGVIAQGFKRSVIGDTEYRFGEGSYMVIGVDMPSVVHITRASAETPYLALSLALDRYLIAQLAVETPSVSVTGKAFHENEAAGVMAGEIDLEMLNAFLRLVELLDTPERIPVFAPMIIREIHYYLLTGPQGDVMRLFSTLGTRSNRIAQAVTWLRENFREPLRIEALAEQVNMASSTFNRHFRQVTNLSPLQFQKRLRLYEAQRLMLTENKDAAVVAFEVGYESAAQFNREYKRQFGEPPHRDKNRLIAAGAITGTPSLKI
jgi:AraC-like DNA-binding protein